MDTFSRKSGCCARTASKWSGPRNTRRQLTATTRSTSRQTCWAVRSPWRRMKRDLAIRALDKALDHCPWDQLRARSRPYGNHRGAVFIIRIAGRNTVHMTIKSGFRSSVKGNCYDNSMVETFFKSIKAELIWQNRLETRRQAEEAIFQYINGFHNPRRRHSSLGGKSPLALRTKGCLNELRGRNISVTRSVIM